MLLISLIAALLVLTTTLMHGYLLAPAIDRLQHYQFGKALTLVLGTQLIVFIHIMQSALYAGGFAYGSSLELGSFKQTDAMNWMDYLYFSLVNYNTLGLGDIYPTGHLRFLAGVEALNGFLLISCSATFIHKMITAKT